MLGLWVLELFAMYATDGQTYGLTYKSDAYCPLPYGRGHNNGEKIKQLAYEHNKSESEKAVQG